MNASSLLIVTTDLLSPGRCFYNKQGPIFDPQVSIPILCFSSFYDSVACRHMITEILQFCPPSGLPVVLLQLLSLSLLEDLVQNFGFEIEVKAESRHKRFVWQLKAYEILNIRHVRTNTELDMDPPIVGPSCAGSGFGVVVIFDDNNFRQIMTCLRQCHLRSSNRQEKHFVTISEEVVTDPEELVNTLVRRCHGDPKYNNTLLVAYTKCLLDYMSVIAPMIAGANTQETFMSAMKSSVPRNSMPQDKRQLRDWGGAFLKDLWTVVLYTAKPSHLPEFIQAETKHNKWGLHPFNRRPTEPTLGGAILRLENMENDFTQKYAQYNLGFSDDLSDQEKRRIARGQEQYVLDLLDTLVSTYLYTMSKNTDSVKFQISDEQDDEE